MSAGISPQRSALTTAGRGGGAPRSGGVPHESGATGAPARENNNERGAAAVELALFLPMLILLVALSVGAVRMVADQNHLNQVTESAARFATRSSVDPLNPEPYSTARTSASVAAYVEHLSDLPILEVVVSPDPTTAYPGTDVTVSITVHHDAGPLADAANAVAGLIGKGPVFPEGGRPMHSAVTMRKE